MGECSTLSQNLPSGSGLCGIKRSRSSDDSDNSTMTSKLLKNDDHHMLIISPERHTDPGSETEFSYQEEETDLCCRSSNSSSSDWSERMAVGRVEFEIRSPNEATNPFGDSSTASDASVNELQVVGLPPPKTWNDAGNSSCVSSGSSDVFDPEIPRRDYWTCLQCSNVNNRPAFRYCEKCYKVRRDMYQPRTKPRKRRKRKSCKGAIPPRSLAPGKGNSEKTGNAKQFQPNSTACGEIVKNCVGPKTSPVAFSGIKLESCSQENKDSGVACSQSSGLGCSQSTAAGKDSDASLSPDSGADTQEFHGVKLLSTRAPSVGVGPKQCVDVVDLLSRVTRQQVGVVDSQSLTLSRDSTWIDSKSWIVSGAADERGLTQHSRSRSVAEVDSARPTTDRGVKGIDCVQTTTSRGFDAVDSVRPRVSRGIDEVDSVGPSVSHSVDVVDTVYPMNRGVDSLRSSVSRGVDEVDSVRLSAIGGVDEVDTVCPTVRGIDKVDFVRHSTSRGVDEVDTSCPPWNRGIGEVDFVRRSTSEVVDEVDTVCPPTNRGIDKVDFVRPLTSRGVDEVDSVQTSTGRDVDEVDSAQTRTSPGVDEVDAVPSGSSRNVDEVDSVRPFEDRTVDYLRPPASRTVGEVDSVQPASSRSLDEVDSVQRCLTRGVDVFNSMRNPSSRSFEEVDSVRLTSSRSLDSSDFASSTATRDDSKVSASKLRSVKTQTDLCFISKSEVPKEKPAVDLDKCMTCFARSLDGIFVHSTYAHMCCCYKCTVKVWKTSKRCPLCNCKVMNVLRLFKGT